MAYDDRALRGVGGWLAFLVIVLGGLTPLAQLGSAFSLVTATDQLASLFGANWPLYRACALGLIGLRMAGSLFLAWRLVYRPIPSSPRIVIVGLWALFSGLGLISLGTVAALSPVPTSFGQIALSMLQPVAICTLWTAYLLRSRRVANTYTDDADDLQAVFE